MGSVVLALHMIINPKSGISELAKVFLCITAGLIVYISSLYAFHVPEMRNLSSLLPRRTTDVETTL